MILLQSHDNLLGLLDISGTPAFTLITDRFYTTGSLNTDGSKIIAGSSFVLAYFEGTASINNITTPSNT